MQIIRRIVPLRRAIADLRSDSGAVALVPTMGALHEGHMALIAEAKRRAPHVVASIFVNPAQFGPNEDLAAYPRSAETDAEMLEEAGCNLLWSPEAAEMYPPGFSTTIRVSGVGEGLCADHRPGHFEGVATVVAKLFAQVRPDIALFGEKDYQQLAVIRRLVSDLDLAVDIVGVPTRRDPDGLALSSRNVYLSVGERAAALALPAMLEEVKRALEGGAPVDDTLARAPARLIENGFDKVDYFALRDAENLGAMARLDRPGRLLVAAWIGKTRLIDNLAVFPPD